MATPHRAGRPEDVIWHADILPRATRQALEEFAKGAWLRESPWYLAGGTALALSVGHRVSVDLDFFSPRTSFSAPRLLAHFPRGTWRTDSLDEGTLYGYLRGARVSFITYPFFHPRQPSHWYGHVRFLDPRDIAVMKVIAISQRGRKRDFVDLYWCCTNREPLEVILQRLPAQYPTVAQNYHHLLNSLTYFVDAEPDPMPALLFKVSWSKIKRFFEREVPKVARELLGLP